MSDNDVMYVRLKPYDKKRGYLVRRYMVAGHEFMTDHETGRPIWNKVMKRAEDYLRALKQNPDDPESKDLFDVMTPEEYQQIREREQAQVMARFGIAESPVRTPEVPMIDRTGGRASAIPDLGPVTSMGTGIREPGLASSDLLPQPTAEAAREALGPSPTADDVEVPVESTEPPMGARPAGTGRGRASRAEAEAP
jgi:hypothetical protein